MSALSALRGELEAALGGLGATVYPFIPELMAAPAFVITPGSPYVTSDGEPFGFYRVTFTIVALAEVSVNEVATNALDDLLSAATAALHNAGFPVQEIGEPYAYQANTALHIAADITVSDSTTF